MKKIIFTLTEPELKYAAQYPEPAIKSLPEWYKNAEPFIGGDKKIQGAGFNETAKKCIPILDSISFGYTIKLWTDIYIEQKIEGTSINTSVRTRDNMRAVEGHPLSQAPGYPFPQGYRKEIFKWINPWQIKTPKGYSCFFISPTHQDIPFKNLEGVVDTDSFPLTVNFPFILEENFSGTIKRGTPMVQVIPFKRDSFRSEEVVFDPLEYNSLKNLHDTSFINKYKNKWWSRKVFS